VTTGATIQRHSEPSADCGAVLVHRLLTHSAQRHPEKIAIVDATGSHTFADLDRLSTGFASWLQRVGIRRGDRVVLMMENCATLVAAFFGVLRAGAVMVVVNPTTKSDKLNYVLNDCGARVLVAANRLARVVLPATVSTSELEAIAWAEGTPGTIDADATTSERANISFEDVANSTASDPRLSDPGLIDEDLAAIIYTSGSTGFPKGVMLTHRNVCHNAWSISTYLELVADDIVASVMPLSFDYGLFQILMSARVGFTVVLEQSFAYPYDVMKRIVEQRVTVLPGVPTIFSKILSLAPYDDLDLSHIRVITNTAAALPPAHIRRLMDLFPRARIYSMYGLTECTRVSYLDPDRLLDKISSVGKAMPNTEVSLVDDDGIRVPPGVVGELVVRGASVMRGYWGKPEETARFLREGEIQGELVLYSGDQFHADDEGFLYFVGRTDDVFKCKGEKISPKEIELVLYELDEVAEAAVVGVPDELDGMAIKAIVVPSSSGTLDENLVRRHCRSRLENFMVPKFVEIRKELPKTESGKIQRSSL
jgi:amino acid adenylation domain-containing protein